MWGWPNSGVAWPQMLWGLHPQRYSEFRWTKPRATCCSLPYSEQRDQIPSPKVSSSLRHSITFSFYKIQVVVGGNALLINLIVIVMNHHCCLFQTVTKGFISCALTTCRYVGKLQKPNSLQGMWSAIASLTQGTNL